MERSARGCASFRAGPEGRCAQAAHPAAHAHAGHRRTVGGLYPDTGRPDRRKRFISAARTLRYGDIITVIDAAKGAGVERVGIVTDGMRRDAGVL
jgi:hypothetical protein